MATERPSKADKRDEVRAQRRAAEADAAKQSRKNSVKNAFITLLAIAVIGALLLNSYNRRKSNDIDQIVVTAEQITTGQAAAGCEAQAVGTFDTPTHFAPAEAPPADAMYTGIRPAAGGPHFQQAGAVATVRTNPLDERAVVHNLEHGAIAFWYDEDVADASDLDAIESWADTLNANGFEASLSGGGLIMSPFATPLASGKGIAVRAWGVAFDCDSFDEDAYNGFVADFYGTHGAAPEGNLSPYPEDVLIRTFAPSNSDATDESTDGASDEPTEESTDGASDEPTEEAS